MLDTLRGEMDLGREPVGMSMLRRELGTNVLLILMCTRTKLKVDVVENGFFFSVRFIGLSGRAPELKANFPEHSNFLASFVRRIRSSLLLFSL